MAVARAGSAYRMETVFFIRVCVFLCWKDLRWVGKQTVYIVNLVFAQGQQGEKTLVLLIIFAVKTRILANNKT